MNKSLVVLLITILISSCQNKKTDSTTATTPAPAAPTAPAAPAGPTGEIWNTPLGMRLKADYVVNPVSQANKDQNIIIEHLAKNNIDMQRTPSGLYYVMEKEGKGSSPTADKIVRIHYRGYFLDGREFDSSYKNNRPVDYRAGGFVPGFTEAILMMKPGGKIKLLIPSTLGYGAMGMPGAIPGNTVLGFELELLQIVQ